ncbi:MAG: hypothetical protein E7222_07735 [Clostridiales bacterium]|nr:hypothetical protein [Clostridiales bacterium]
MKKFAGLILIAFLFVSAVSVDAYASNNLKAKPTASNLYLNSESIGINGFNIENSNYFKLRDLARLFLGTSSQFDVTWNSSANAIEITTNKTYTPASGDNLIKTYDLNKTYWASPSNSKIIIDGKSYQIKAYTIDNSNYFKLRDLGEIIPFDVKWDSKTNTIQVYSKVLDNTYKTKISNELITNALSDYYSTTFCASSKLQYVFKNSNETLSVADVVENSLIISTYDNNFNLISEKKIPFELPILGTFYSGKKYNYIAFGQVNYAEDDKIEVMRIVKYDKDFNKIGSVSIKGGDSMTQIPFRLGEARMAENSNILVLHAPHQMYKDGAGLNHQMQITIVIDTDTMKVTNNINGFQANHVSHSFDQYVLFDGEAPVFVDLGDASPRAVCINIGRPFNSNTNFDDGGADVADYPNVRFTPDKGMFYTPVNLFEIPGRYGDNYTGVMIGGFEISKSNYLVTLHTIDQAKFEDINTPVQRDIMVCILPKGQFAKDSVKKVTIAKYVDTDKTSSTPKFVKISDEKFMIIWQEYKKAGNAYKRNNLKYGFIDENGNIIGDTKELEGYILSDCQPIIINNAVTWAVNQKNIRTIYTIPL